MQNPTFGARLRAIRELARVSQGQLASASGINQSTIARIESGDRDNPNLDTVEKLAGALGVSLAELLGLQVGAMDAELRRLWTRLSTTNRAKLLVTGYLWLEVDERSEYLKNLGYRLNEDALFFGGDLRTHIERMVKSILETQLQESALVTGDVEISSEVAK